MFQTLKRKTIQIHTIIRTPTTKQLNGETGTIQNERDTMTVYYHVLLQSENGESSITRTFNSDTDTSDIINIILRLMQKIGISEPKLALCLVQALSGAFVNAFFRSCPRILVQLTASLS